MKTEKSRHVVFFGDYFEDFFQLQDKNVQNKISWTLSLIEELPRLPSTFLKQLTDTNGLYEIRVQFKQIAIRIFCLFGKQRTLVILNGFVKKSKRTPKREINLALTLKRSYEESQHNNT